MASGKSGKTARRASAATPFSSEVRGFIRAFVQELTENNAAIFAGAGLSAAKGYVNWKELLRTVADELDLDVDRETNLVAVAQFHFNERQNRTVINRRIIDEFSAVHGVTENHEILARLPISTYWTTNYDHLIETALVQADKIPDVKYTVKQLKKTVLGREAVVYKMHGDADHPDDAILTKDDYEGYFREHELFVTKLSGDLVEKTFLFLGFSFTDPNIDYVMSRVRVTLRRSPKQHYCILRREQRTPRETLANFEYRKRQQSYFVKDLGRIGIQSLMIDNYSEITEILLAVETAYRGQTVFISGSAHEFGVAWRADVASKFLHSLSAALVEQKFRVVTGFGLGVGPAVIGGALQTILSNRRKFKETQLIAKPFPVGTASPRALERIYRQYREEMVAHAGIAIFVFGNKRDTKGNVVDADGVIDEFLCARDAGLKLIPIGATGYVAKQLWDGVMGDLSSYLPGASPAAIKAFSRLGKPGASPDELVADVLKLIRELRTA